MSEVEILADIQQSNGMMKQTKKKPPSFLELGKKYSGVISGGVLIVSILCPPVGVAVAAGAAVLSPALLGVLPVVSEVVGVLKGLPSPLVEGIQKQTFFAHMEVEAGKVLGKDRMDLMFGINATVGDFVTEKISTDVPENDADAGQEGEGNEDGADTTEINAAQQKIVWFKHIKEWLSDWVEADPESLRKMSHAKMKMKQSVMLCGSETEPNSDYNKNICQKMELTKVQCFNLCSLEEKAKFLSTMVNFILNDGGCIGANAGAAPEKFVMGYLKSLDIDYAKEQLDYSSKVASDEKERVRRKKQAKRLKRTSKTFEKTAHIDNVGFSQRGFADIDISPAEINLFTPSEDPVARGVKEYAWKRLCMGKSLGSKNLVNYMKNRLDHPITSTSVTEEQGFEDAEHKKCYEIYTDSVLRRLTTTQFCEALAEKTAKNWRPKDCGWKSETEEYSCKSGNKKIVLTCEAKINQAIKGIEDSEEEETCQTCIGKEKKKWKWCFDVLNSKTKCIKQNRLMGKSNCRDEGWEKTKDTSEWKSAIKIEECPEVSTTAKEV